MDRWMDTCIRFKGIIGCDAWWNGVSIEKLAGRGRDGLVKRASINDN